MAGVFDVIPPRIIALVVGPLLLGVVVLGVLFDLNQTGWAFVFTVVAGGLTLLVIVGARLLLLHKQASSVDTVEAEPEIPPAELQPAQFELDDDSSSDDTDEQSPRASAVDDENV